MNQTTQNRGTNTESARTNRTWKYDISFYSAELIVLGLYRHSPLRNDDYTFWFIWVLFGLGLCIFVTRCISYYIQNFKLLKGAATLHGFLFLSYSIYTSYWLVCCASFSDFTEDIEKTYSFVFLYLFSWIIFFVDLLELTIYVLTDCC